MSQIDIERIKTDLSSLLIKVKELRPQNSGCPFYLSLHEKCEEWQKKYEHSLGTLRDYENQILMLKQQIESLQKELKIQRKTNETLI